jgi:acetoin utilization deacetylase AcuC-like enzyme
VLLIATPRFGDHTTPLGHPERFERAGVFDEVARRFAAAGGHVREPRQATRADLSRVHDEAYLDRLDRSAGVAVMLDSDTFTGPASDEVARLAAGAAIDAAWHAARTGEPALALVRPPGHHAEPDRAMGFCLLNNIAIAAASLRAGSVERVAILDFDVHHGNGTQAAFYSDPTVLFASSHQYPYYPGTGAAAETGAGAGLGFTVNVPLAAGAGDAELLSAYDDGILPAVARFRPDVMLVSAGYDAHEADPLGSLRVTTGGFRALIERLDAFARQKAGGRIAFVTEGGYDLAALDACLGATIDVLARRG